MQDVLSFSNHSTFQNIPRTGRESDSRPIAAATGKFYMFNPVKYGQYCIVPGDCIGNDPARQMTGCQAKTGIGLSVVDLIPQTPNVRQTIRTNSQ